MGKMKLCKTCGKEVAKSAKVCPNCGANLKTGIFKKVGIGFGIIIVICIIIGVTNSNGSDTQPSSNQNSPSKTNIQTQQKKNTKPTWNKKETDASKNGNVSVAVDLIKSNGNLKAVATSPSPSAVAKAPWNYYGKVVKIAGEICDIQEYPTGSDWSKLLGGKEAGQIVISSDDGTITDMFIMGTTGDLKLNDKVTLYGYPVGLSDVDNKLGGKTTQLFIVGNSFDKQ